MKTSLEIFSRRGLGTVEYTGTFALDASNALEESISTLAGEILPQQIGS
jgi:putative transposase